MAKRCRSCCASSSVSGTITRCAVGGTISPGATVEIRLQSDNSLLWSGTAGSDGTYSAGLNLSGDTNVTVKAIETGSDAARYVTTSKNFTLIVGANPGTNVAINPATGYHCFHAPGVGWRAIKNTLNLSDTAYGATTITYDITVGVNAWKSGSLLVNYPGSSQCSPANGVGLRYTLRVNNTSPLQYLYGSTGNGNCPVPQGQSNLAISPVYANGTLVLDPLNLTFTAPASTIAMYPSGTTITITE